MWVRDGSHFWSLHLVFGSARKDINLCSEIIIFILLEAKTVLYYYFVQDRIFSYGGTDLCEDKICKFDLTVHRKLPIVPSIAYTKANRSWSGKNLIASELYF